MYGFELKEKKNRNLIFGCYQLLDILDANSDQDFRYGFSFPCDKNW